MKIMIVDDSASIREIVRDALATANNDFAECEDGDQALSLYERYRPDWVVMDIMMKRVDGLRATRDILASDPKAKIIVLTQLNEWDLREKAVAAGAIDFVLKDDIELIGEIICPEKN